MAGISHHVWYVDQDRSITVAPPRIIESNLPILSSTQRPGDLVIDNYNRKGDPFEIKAYHPSDGVKKIVWKAFAKRGELLSRHPEASMTPEGYVVILVLAGPDEDQVCSKALAYLRTLDELKLDTLVGCQGGKDELPAHNATTAEALFIDTVWRSHSPTGESLKADATALLESSRRAIQGVAINKLLIFCSGERVSDSNGSRSMNELAEWLQAQGISPVFCMAAPSRPLHSGAATKIRGVSRWFVTPEPSSINAKSPVNYHEFLAGCLQRQWEVLV